MALWQIFILFSALTCLFILWPFIRNKVTTFNQAVAPEGAVQKKLFHEHLAELEASFGRGDVDEAQYQQLKTELQKNFVTDGLGETLKPVQAGGIGWLWAGVVLVPVLAWVGYTQLGAKKDWDIYQMVESVGQASTQQAYDQQIKALMTQVQSRVNEKAGNAQMVNLLAELAMNAKDYPLAVTSYQKMDAEFPNSAMVIAKLAEAMFYQAGFKVTPEVREQVKKALKLAPMLPNMLGLAGVDANAQGQYAEAIQFWKRAISVMEPGSPQAQAYTAGITKAEQALAASGASTAATAENTSAPADKPMVKVQAKVQVKVTLDPQMTTTGSETLFVYARAFNGSKMPLAIQRLSAAQLPLEVTLDESMAMAEGMTIKSAPQLELVARISKSGTAVPQSGDLIGQVGPISLDQLKEAVSITINSRVP